MQENNIDTETLDVFEYVSTYNNQNPDLLEEWEQQALDRMDTEDKTHYWRTLTVDEDLLAQFCELNIKIQIALDWFKSNSEAIQAIQNRLDAAKAGDYLPRDVFMQYVNILKKRKANASAASPRYKQIKAEQEALLAKEPSLWARWYNEEEPEEWLQEYLSRDINNYSTWGGRDESDEDTEKPDSRMSPSDEIYADTHIQDMYEYERPFKENPKLGDFWDWRKELDCKRAGEFQQHLAQDEEAFKEFIQSLDF